jgi:hypothetical protein
VSACKLVPSVNSTDGTPTLADPEPPPLTETTYSLDGTAVNDFTDPLGLQRYCYENDGLETDFTWVPNTPDGASLAGQLTVRAFEMGGDVAVQLTTDFSWPCTGKPAWTDAAAADTAGAGKSAKS